MISESQHYIRNLIKFKKYTPKGLLYLEEWGSLRLAANTAYLALVTAKLDPDSSDDLLQFAKARLLKVAFYRSGSTRKDLKSTSKRTNCITCMDLQAAVL